jgi:hypothetical protein
MALAACKALDLLTLDALNLRDVSVATEVIWFIYYLSTIDNFLLDGEYVDLMVRLIIFESELEYHDSDICIAAATVIHNVAIKSNVKEIISLEDMQSVVTAIMKMNSVDPYFNLREAHAYVLFDFAIACPALLAYTGELDKTIAEMVGSDLEFQLYVRSFLAEILSICNESMFDQMC